ncbi:lasso RiPP family leader peptide-containing protein [Candidatus Binatus sp.]|uniref:lasso RiPP family leader peptide-containing protein n=1 Tax=Candidatus Binatus sp. TaxID=2811406 RepID=UPI003BB02821
MAKSTKARQTPEKQSFKKPYTSPRLVEYGNVTKLTASGGSAPNDGSGTFLIRKVTP